MAIPKVKPKSVQNLHPPLALKYMIQMSFEILPVALFSSSTSFLGAFFSTAGFPSFDLPSADDEDESGLTVTEELSDSDDDDAIKALAAAPSSMVGSSDGVVAVEVVLESGSSIARSLRIPEAKKPSRSPAYSNRPLSRATAEQGWRKSRSQCRGMFRNTDSVESSLPM